MNGATDALAGLLRHPINLDRGARHRAIGLNTAGCARDQPADADFRFRANSHSVRLTACNKSVDLAERARRKRRLTMVYRTENEVGRALERRAFGGDAGRRAR